MSTDLLDCGKSEAELLALPLKSGNHPGDFHGECCLVEKANRIATCVPAFRERYGKAAFADDHPSISRVVRSMATGLNDMRWESDEKRTEALDPFTILILGTKTTEADEQIRAWMATDWLVRVYTPAWLRLAGLTAEAESLEGLARIVDATLAREAQPTINAAREKSAAARAAARDAAGDAARDAAGDAAGAAAWDAARAAARDAARDAARAAARDAARAAAWDAARNVRRWPGELTHELHPHQSHR